MAIATHQLAMSRSMAYHAEVQHAIADMALELEAIGPHLDKIVQDWLDGADHGMMWGAKLVAVKHRAVEGAWKVANTALTREFVAETVLGINIDERPRWD